MNRYKIAISGYYFDDPTEVVVERIIKCEEEELDNCMDEVEMELAEDGMTVTSSGVIDIDYYVDW